MTSKLNRALAVLRAWLIENTPFAPWRALPLTPSHGWLLPATSIVRSQWEQEARPRRG
jgi:hypothetical protein